MNALRLDRFASQVQEQKEKEDEFTFELPQGAFQSNQAADDDDDLDRDDSASDDLKQYDPLSAQSDHIN